jgi:hypothetical protein
MISGVPRGKVAIPLLKQGNPLILINSNPDSFIRENKRGRWIDLEFYKFIGINTIIGGLRSHLPWEVLR